MITGVLIVKNEAGRIVPTLESFAPYVDRFVICDTGSTDSTVEEAKAWFHQWGQSEVLSISFENYSSARNRALQAADSAPGWLMMIDCDQRITGSPYVFRQELRDLRPEVLAASLPCDVGTARLARYCLVRSGVGFDGPGTPGGWHYRGVTHEALGNSSGGLVGSAELPDPILSYDIQDHSRRLARWKEKDFPLLRAEIRKNPRDGRSLFYLGQTCQCIAEAGENPIVWFPRAIEYYRARVDLGVCYGGHPFDEELFHTHYRIGECLLRQGVDRHGILEAYMSAWAMAPHRAEPLDKLSRVFLGRGQILPALHFAHAAAELPYPKEDRLFVDRTLYEGGARAHKEFVEDILRRASAKPSTISPQPAQESNP